MIPSDVVGPIVAALGGAAVGLERQWSGHAEGPAARFAGIRTFTMLGGLAGVSGSLWSASENLLATILLAGGVAIIIAGYIAASRKQVDGTKWRHSSSWLRVFWRVSASCRRPAESSLSKSCC